MGYFQQIPLIAFILSQQNKEAQASKGLLFCCLLNTKGEHQPGNGDQQQKQKIFLLHGNSLQRVVVGCSPDNGYPTGGVLVICLRNVMEM